MLVIINVLTRYVFHTGIPWAEEMATSCFVWTAFIGSAACYKMRAHVGVDIVVNKLPLKVQNVVKIVVDILMAFLCAYLFYLSCVYLKRSYRSQRRNYWACPHLGLFLAGNQLSGYDDLVVHLYLPRFEVYSDLRQGARPRWDGGAKPPEGGV